MEKEKTKRIEDLFRHQVRKDSKVKNAYLLVHSQKLDIHMNIAEGSTGDIPANPDQPNYMASVGKLFTATIISILYEKGELSFDDTITDYLDEDLLKDLHVYKGIDYTHSIKIKHLLKQTSGLYDHFWPLLKKLLKEKEFNISPREAVIWGKNNLKPYAPPGKKTKYSDTNYHLLGLIIENITGKPFHEVLKDYIFVPLGMENASMYQYSDPIKKYDYPIAHFSINEIIGNDLINYAGLDYTGGGVVATNEDLLIFMKALVTGQIVSKDTLEKMKNDSSGLYMSIDYGYSIWQFRTIPVLMPEKYSCWGCVGVTGAFMFYHPKSDAYLIGNFNDVSYKSKGLRFMLKVIKELNR
ncbi:MAG: serine hydrolase [Firmicutes bacterium HGW-Firmicutes-2]|jgi:D-alanyl-D-alanine carboxypeptidase|nr:MAG: serine hydrolase [Firmicutes bacterium HGW-Firmicutes-2]